MLSNPRGRILGILAFLAIVIAGCTTVGSSGKEEPTPTPLPPPPVPVRATYTVRRGEVVDNLTFTARVSPVVEEELFFRVAGRVERVLVSRNDWVEEGQLLAELQNEDLVRQLAQAQIEMDTAETNLQRAYSTQEDRLAGLEGQLEIKRLQLDRAREGLVGLDLDIQIARVRLNAARNGPSAEDIEIAERSIERAKNTLWANQASRDATCGTPSAACDQAQAAVNNAEENVRIAELNLKKLLAGPAEEDLLTLRANYERALQRRREADLDLTIRELEISLTEQEIARLQDVVDPQLMATVDRTRLTLERLDAQIANTQIISPINGRVATINANEGREVNAYSTAIVISDETDLEITAQPTSAQMQRMSEGMPVELVLSQYPGRVLHGEIYQLPYPHGSGGGTSLEATDRNTRISFDPGDLDLKPGDLVRVDVTIEQKTDALWVPPAAIRTFAGRSFVVVQEGDIERRVDVVLGIQGADRIEIREGVEEGQIILGQ
jgi:multidrug efflux pump subunit AcrA (membrane-fusion protein)